MERILRQFIETYAKARGFKLSDKCDVVIKGLIKKEGCCPCKLIPNPCPCVDHEKEIEETGHCHCNLFVKDYLNEHSDKDKK